MKIFSRIYVVLFVLVAGLGMYSLQVFAHAGVEKQAGNTTVYLKQFPLSPLVGEEVKFYFGFNDRTTHRQLSNMDVHVRVIDTYTGDESRDVTILEKNITTDMNGDFDFAYTFTHQNYFDVEVSMVDQKSGEPVDTGFLVQVRGASSTDAMPTGHNSFTFFSGVFSALMVSALVLFIYKVL